MRALCLIREATHYRRECFCAGLRANGYQVQTDLHDPTPEDIVVMWNRYGRFHEIANQFEAAGARVIVAENGYFGKSWLGRSWFALALSHHNGAGRWNDGGPARWDALDVELAPWRDGGREIVLLPQRGIGPPGVGMPKDWTRKAQARLRNVPHRVRAHPGKFGGTPLDSDLAKASSVLTWGSGAALKALLLGIPVHYDMPNWIGADAAARSGSELFRGDRLPMLRRLSWALWTLEEIAAGDAFAWLL